MPQRHEFQCSDQVSSDGGTDLNVVEPSAGLDQLNEAGFKRADLVTVALAHIDSSLCQGAGAEGLLPFCYNDYTKRTFRNRCETRVSGQRNGANPYGTTVRDANFEGLTLTAQRFSRAETARCSVARRQSRRSGVVRKNPDHVVAVISTEEGVMLLTPPGSRFRRRLTDAEVEQIRSTMKQSGSQAGFDLLWDIILQEAENVTAQEGAEQGLTFQVRDYAIPSDQDAEVQRLLSVPPSRTTRKRWSRRSTGMAFLFFGPATFEEDTTA